MGSGFTFLRPVCRVFMGYSAKHDTCSLPFIRGVKNYAYVSSGGMYKDSDEVSVGSLPTVH